MDLPLFRPNVVHPGRRAQIGEIVLARPIEFAYLVAACAAISVLIICFLIFGSYTQRSSSSGQLVPDRGVIKVYAPQPGTIVEKNVVEGQKVRRGETLYVLTGERRSSAFGETQSIISTQVQERITSLHDQVEIARSLLRVDTEAAESKLGMLLSEQRSVTELITGVRSRVELMLQKQDRYEELRQQGYVSQDQWQSVELEALDQKARLAGLERDRIGLARQISEQRALLATQPIRHESLIAEYRRAIAEATESLTESESRRKWLAVAPESGVATAVVGELGQTTDSQRPLLSIVPEDARLQARLYLASNAVGFVKEGDAVHLRFHAYPYQKFGHHKGTVASVSRVSASTTELIGDDAINSVLHRGEPVFQLTVELDSQEIILYGRRQVLQAGMLVDADLMQETRRLYEWVLEPLTTLTGRMR
jgi:membrane fusion protein